MYFYNQFYFLLSDIPFLSYHILWYQEWDPKLVSTPLQPATGCPNFCIPKLVLVITAGWMPIYCYHIPRKLAASWEQPVASTKKGSFCLSGLTLWTIVSFRTHSCITSRWVAWFSGVWSTTAIETCITFTW